MPEESFDWVSLEPGEQIEWSGEPRMHSIIPSLVVGIPLLVVGIGAIIIVADYLRIKNTDYVVTNQGLYKKTGIMSRSVKKIGFDKVQNISFSQGVLGNQFGYGDIDISTAGGAGVEMKFRSINNPKEVQELINRWMRGGESGDSSSDMTEKEILLKIWGELDEIRKNLEGKN